MTTREHFLVTGALGCIGAWVLRLLLRDGHSVTAFDLSEDQHRLRLIMTPGELANLTMMRGDLTDLATVEDALRTSGAQHLIHLAALQVPACRANPSLGARVNVVGTANVFQAAASLGLPRVIYASSVAVYGGPDEYPPGLVPGDAPLHPHSLYGVYKQANEATARVFWQDHAISSIGLRPYTIYGPGRDQGLTSAPTRAMLAAAAGQPYHIPFGGTCGFQYAEDVARLFIAATRADFNGAGVFNLRGHVGHMREMVAAIEATAPDVAGQITYDDAPLPFPEGFDDTALAQVIGSPPATALADGVAATIDQFRAALAAGKITTEG
jgi:nucleoside-diphosphate-sugar epimerase